MNALQIISPKPVARIRKSALRFRVSDAILLLAVIGGMSMSRGEEGTASEAGAAVVVNDGRDKAGDNEKAPSATQPAAASVGTTTEGSGSVKTDQKAGGDAGEGAAAEAKSDTAVRTETRDRNVHDRDSSTFSRSFRQPLRHPTHRRAISWPKLKMQRSGRRHPIRRLFARQGWFGGPTNQEGK
jgi:hypothetical protein